MSETLQGSVQGILWSCCCNGQSRMRFQSDDQHGAPFWPARAPFQPTQPAPVSFQGGCLQNCRLGWGNQCAAGAISVLQGGIPHPSYRKARGGGRGDSACVVRCCAAAAAAAAAASPPRKFIGAGLPALLAHKLLSCACTIKRASVLLECGYVQSPVGGSVHPNLGSSFSVCGLYVLCLSE